MGHALSQVFELHSNMEREPELSFSGELSFMFAVGNVVIQATAHDCMLGPYATAIHRSI